ncbi:MAG: PAS domain-containing sensor histidine kinase [Candidatus Margulisbacteria bacterium]|nr:PAS domain-containing sensor histidine kinase [Candidatus Margulisiibacteriota bacterium]MBU1021292.1 PAS domain-containing sensor histidine kinase [Candidatus Margulisiibacteriota bacterium]MBU1729219.1 PAS domain-containing sensor histidine kinase [Candidatus Margulisiibacteriota bacterium]MBU1954892.1 PAS domain-containing sensor histidine kinase [Candidatus Margulisiibacteriota bacterium]
MGELHSLLKRQLKKIYDGVDLVPKEISELVAVINNAYQQADIDRGLLERSLEISSQELLQNISELKQAEEAQRKSEERFKQVAENAGEWIWEVDANAVYTYASPVVEKILGYKPEELVGKKHCFDLFTPETREELRKAIFEIFAKKGSFIRFINSNVHKNGSIVFLETGGCPILDVKGNLLGYRGADTDVTERKRTEEEKDKLYEELMKYRLRLEELVKERTAELTIVNQKLKEMDKRKSDFVANVSHEFLSPLATSKQYLELLLDGAVGKIGSKRRDRLKSIEKNVDRLARLVSNMLDISKIESGKIELKKESVDIRHLVEEILMTNKNEFKKKQISLKKDTPSDIISIFADKDMLTEVIINLLDNAIKYTPDKGAITIKLEDKAGEVRFEIWDSGPGIPQEYSEKIFDKFERITAEQKEGTGLGLPIAKDIIDLHKGKIWVESRDGKGSKFIFTIPKNLKEPK